MCKQQHSELKPEENRYDFEILTALFFEQQVPNPKSELCLVYKLSPALWQSFADLGITSNLLLLLLLKTRLQVFQQKLEALGARISKGKGCVCAYSI